MNALPLPSRVLRTAILLVLVGAGPPGFGGIGPAQAQNPWEGTPQLAFLDSPIVKKFQCVTCHTITDQGGTVGPILNLVGMRRSEDWIRKWLNDPNAVKPGTKMPKFPFSQDELKMAVGYLTKMKRALHTQEILSRGQPAVETGKALFEDYDCYACHRVGNQGRFVGPELTFVGVRKTEDWERIWLHDPPAFKPGTFMPNLHIPEAGVKDLAAYLHTLQGQANEESRAWEMTIHFMVDNNDVRRGEYVFKRLACWSCHGENGRGGVSNPNAAKGHEIIPDLTGVRDAYSIEEFRAMISRRITVQAADPNVLPQPFFCPAYPEDALNQLELEDLFAYVSSLAPPKRRFKFQ